MKNIILILFCFACILFPLKSFSQNRNSIWCFGDSSKINFFNGAISSQSSANARGSATSICDTAGNLEFYACTKGNNWNIGGRIFNSNDNLMQGGDSIYGENWYHELTIIPKPASNNIYYLFSIGIVFNTPGFYYSVIDMSLNGGLGAVVQKNVQLNSFKNADCVTAIKHGNGRDWWVISKTNNSSTYFNEFYLYLVTPDTIFLQSIQQFNNSVDAGLLRIAFNSNGNKMMQNHAGGLLCEYDFDRCSGIISNPNEIFPNQLSNFTRLFWEGDYSSDGTKYYVGTMFFTNIDTSYLIQYDLTSSNIPASADTLGRVAWPVQGGAVRLAPDKKIYYSCFYDWGFPGYPYPDSVHNMYNENLGVINYPDSLGAKCDYQPFSFYLGGKRTYYGLPNNPNYELGPDTGSVCDSLGLLTPETPKPPLWGLNTTYISAWEKLFVNAQNLKGKHLTITIYDATGKVKFSRGKPPVGACPDRSVGGLGVFGGYFTLDVDCSGWASGLYVVHLQTEKEMLSTKFVKE